MDKEKLKQFFANQCSYEECKVIASYLEDNEAALDELTMFEEIASSEILPTSWAEKSHYYRQLGIARRQNIQRLSYSTVAAAIVILAFIFSFFRLGQQKNAIDSLGHAYTIRIMNDEPTIKLIHLPDSSTLLLSPAAQIAYRSDFVSNRQVQQLEGIVTYHVRKGRNSPFRVNYRGLETKAVGTVFTIQDLDETHLSIELSEGKIVVEDQARLRMGKVYLEGHEKIVVNTVDFSYKRAAMPTQNFTETWELERVKTTSGIGGGQIEWTNSFIRFQAVDNAHVFSIIERLYGVKVLVESQHVLQGNFTGTLYNKDDLNILFANFCQMNGCTYQLEQAVVIIK
ncbi:FecR family protein [Sphingobacterium suaedae]|uniref:FecR family protein n=1 Tax=Sphingobacterium suaedae TaxID=1686402 RepID=A0ABW5KDY0_9SPHI